MINEQDKRVLSVWYNPETDQLGIADDQGRLGILVCAGMEVICSTRPSKRNETPEWIYVGVFN